MATGAKTFEGLAVPLLGESNIRQQTAADDVITITGAAGQTGRFLVTRNSSQTEFFGITLNGNPILRRYTTRPTTGLVKNELMLLYHNSVPKLGVCISTAGQTIKLIRLRTKTFGRLTA